MAVDLEILGIERFEVAISRLSIARRLGLVQAPASAGTYVRYAATAGSPASARATSSSEYAWSSSLPAA